MLVVLDLASVSNVDGVDRAELLDHHLAIAAVRVNGIARIELLAQASGLVRRAVRDRQKCHPRLVTDFPLSGGLEPPQLVSQRDGADPVLFKLLVQDAAGMLLDEFLVLDRRRKAHDADRKVRDRTDPFDEGANGGHARPHDAREEIVRKDLAVSQRR